MNTSEQIINIVKEYVDDDIEIQLNSTLMSELDLDSLRVMQIVCRLEECYDVTIPDVKIPTFLTISDVIKYIEGD